MSTTTRVGEDAKVAISLVLRFDGRVPREGLDADEVASVAEGMAKAVQFVAERGGAFDGDHVLHLTEVKPGSSTFHFLLEVAGAAQSALPVITENHLSIEKIGEIFSLAVKLLEFLKGKPPKATATIDGDNNVTVTNSEGATTVVYSPVFNITGNAYFHEQVVRSVKPLRKVGRTLALQQDERPLLSTASEQYPSIASRVLNDNQPVNTSTIEATLRVRQPHLEGEGSWRFSWVLSALAPTSIVGRMKVEISQAACNTLRTVAVRRRKWNLR
jgi:hypothetical protein